MQTFEINKFISKMHLPASLDHTNQNPKNWCSFFSFAEKKFSKFIDRDDAKSLMGNLSTLLFYLKFKTKNERKKRKKINKERNKQKYNSQLQNYFSWLVDKDTYKK